MRTASGPAPVLFVLLLSAGLAGADPATPAPPTVSPAPTAAVAGSGGALALAGLVPASEALGKDVLDEALSWASAKYAQPSGTFRAAGVRPRKVNAGTVSHVGGGFRVRFASGSQVTTPAVYQGLLFVSGGFSSRELYAFDAKSGKPAWALDLDDDGPSAPACDDGICVVNTESCTLFVVSAKTGKLLWAKWLGDPLMSAPAISGGKVFASYPVSQTTAGKRPARATHALAAFELETGKVVWQRWIDGDVISSPVVVGDQLWAATFSGTVYELGKADGKILAAHRAKATSAPVVVADNLYFSARKDDAHGRAGEGLVGYGVGGGGAGKGYVAAAKPAAYLDKKVQAHAAMKTKAASQDAANGFGDGAPADSGAAEAEELVGQGNVSSLQGHQGARVVALKDRNVATMGDEVVCTDSKSGKKLWSVKVEGDTAKEGGFLATAPIAAGNAVLVGTTQGEVLQIDPDTGKVVKRWKVGAPVRAQPVVEDGWIYASTEDGRLVAIDTGDKSLTGWSQWGGDAERTSVKK